MLIGSPDRDKAADEMERRLRSFKDPTKTFKERYEERDRLLSDPEMVRFYARLADQRWVNQTLLMTALFAFALGVVAGLTFG